MQGWCLFIMKTLNSFNILCKLCPIRLEPPPHKKKPQKTKAKKTYRIMAKDQNENVSSF